MPGHPAAELAAAFHLLSLSGADWALAPFSCSHLGWAQSLFPFGNVAAEGPRVAERLLRTVANFLPVDKWSLGLHLAKCREKN